MKYTVCKINTKYIIPSDNCNLMKRIPVFLFFLAPLYSQNNIYDSFFQQKTRTQYNDTMFERVIWHKKVSHLVIETVRDGYFVTMLVIPESPDNFKSQTYPLHYHFASYDEAFKKFLWLDKFLKSKGILKVRINGNLITGESMLTETNPSN